MQWSKVFSWPIHELCRNLIKQTVAKLLGVVTTCVFCCVRGYCCHPCWRVSMYEWIVFIVVKPNGLLLRWWVDLCWFYVAVSLLLMVCLWGYVAEMFVWFEYDVFTCFNYQTQFKKETDWGHRRNLGWGRGVAISPPHYFSSLRIIFFRLLSWRGNKLECSVGKGCVYSKDLLEPVLPFFLAWILRKWRFEIPMVEFASPPPPLQRY